MLKASELATTHRAWVTCIWCAGEGWRHGEVCLGDMHPSFLHLSVKLSVYSFLSSGWLLPRAHLFHPVLRWVVPGVRAAVLQPPRLLPARPPSPGSSELLPGPLQQSRPFCGLGADRPQPRGPCDPGWLTLPVCFCRRADFTSTGRCLQHLSACFLNMMCFPTEVTFIPVVLKFENVK